MKRSKVIIFAIIIVYITSSCILLFGFCTSFLELTKATLTAVCTASIIALPNMLLLQFGRQNDATKRVEKIIAALLDALCADFPRIEFGKCQLAKLQECEKKIAKLATDFSYTLSNDFFLIGKLEEEFTHSAFAFCVAMRNLEEHISEQKVFEHYCSAVNIAKYNLLEKIEAVRSKVVK